MEYIVVVGNFVGFYLFGWWFFALRRVNPLWSFPFVGRIWNIKELYFITLDTAFCFIFWITLHYFCLFTFILFPFTDLNLFSIRLYFSFGAFSSSANSFHLCNLFPYIINGCFILFLFLCGFGLIQINL